MPDVFTEWTVLPHRPIEKLADNLWRVSGEMGNVQRQMVTDNAPEALRAVARQLRA
jgi:hypothetical protein